MIGIQNNHYRADGVWDRRYALPAAMTLSNRGSFLNLPASLFHHGRRDTFRTNFNSDLILRSSRSRTVTRRSNFVAVDGMALLLSPQEYIKWEEEESQSLQGVGGVTKGQAVTYTLSDGKKIQKVTEVVTGTGSVVRAASFQHRWTYGEWKDADPLSSEVPLAQEGNEDRRMVVSERDLRAES